MEIILGKTSGFCYGVKRAVDGTNEELKQYKKMCCLGEIVHNRQVVEDLENKGLIFIENIEEADNDTIIRAHGVEKKVYEEANKNGIKLIDFTCPSVLRIHKIVEEYAQKEYYIFLCGSSKHPENMGTMSYCGEYYSVIENVENVEKALNEFKKSKLKRLLLISQTTYSIKSFKNIEKNIRVNILDEIEFVVNNTICRATELRQKETEEISKKVEYMIIIGGKNSSNTKKLYDIAISNCENTICVETKEELNLQDIKKYKKIGIMAGASTPEISINEILEKIKRQP